MDESEISPSDQDASDEDDDACIPSDLISPSYFYSNDQNADLTNEDGGQPRAQGSHIRLISKMKSLETVTEGSGSRPSIKRLDDI